MSFATPKELITRIEESKKPDQVKLALARDFIGKEIERRYKGEDNFFISWSPLSYDWLEYNALPTLVAELRAAGWNATIHDAGAPNYESPTSLEIRGIIGDDR